MSKRQPYAFDDKAGLYVYRGEISNGKAPVLAYERGKIHLARITKREKSNSQSPAWDSNQVVLLPSKKEGKIFLQTNLIKLIRQSRNAKRKGNDKRYNELETLISLTLDKLSLLSKGLNIR